MAIIPGTAKVLNQYENVNTTYGGSKAMKAQSKWYTMDDVLETVEANIPGGGVTEIIAGDGISVDQSTGAVTVSSTVEPYVAPYTVFTALVSQTGGDNPNTIGGGSTMLLGVTYYIDTNSDGVDLTVFGAPDSNPGTYFICTTAGELPIVAGSLLLTYNDGAPTVTVLENTIGNIYFKYSEPGRYIIQSNGLFIDFKTFINGAKLGTDYAVSNLFIEPSSGTLYNRGYSLVIETGAGENIIQLNTLKSAGTYDDDIIQGPICIEIRVYN